MTEGDDAYAPRRVDPRLAATVRSMPFPATRADLVERLADIVLEVAHERLPAADLARGLPQARFPDARAAQRALDARWMRIAENLAAVEAAERSARSGTDE